MCLFSRHDYDVEFANRVVPRRRTMVYARPTRFTETVETLVWQQPAPQPPSPIVRDASPPPPPPAPQKKPPAPQDKPPAPPPAPEPSPPRVEVISVVEEHGNPRSSKSSVGRRSRHSGDEIYIERERERVRLDPRPDGYERYRYVEVPKKEVRFRRSGDGRRSGSITFDVPPRSSSRTVERERERFLIEDGDRRREYYHRL